MAQNHTWHHGWLSSSALARLLGKNGFWISEACTLGIVCHVAEKLWYTTHFPTSTWGFVLALWLVASIGTEIWGESAGKSGFVKCKGWLRSLALCLCGLIVKVSAGPFSWRQAGAFALISFAALGINRVFLGLIEKFRETDSWEGLRFGAAQCVALYAIHPYIRSGLVGAGDAKSYSMIIADFLEQWRSGIFPVFIGQSQFSLNGGFQLIRNAPYFPHLAWFLNLLSIGTLNVFALQNLTILTSMLGAILSCYAALRISLSNGRWLALGLASLYGLCPGALAPLYAGDMFPTFMTLPFIPWLVLGLEQCSILPNRIWPWALQAAALAAIWLAHPPVAAWATLPAILGTTWIFLRERKWEVSGRIFFGLGVFLALSGYLFVSVSSLQLPGFQRADALSSIDGKITVLRHNWMGGLLPVSWEGKRLLSDIQLGYGLWGCLLLALVGVYRGKSGRLLLVCFSIVLLFAWPVPIISELTWRGLPSMMLIVTTTWPMERLYVVLDALAVFIIASAFSRYSSRGRWQKISVAMLVLIACSWSISESLKFIRGKGARGSSERDSEEMHLPENITLSRSHSYEYLGVPAYYSNGHMDPRLETRLLDIQTWRPIADGSTYMPDSEREYSQPRSFVLQHRVNDAFPQTFHIGSGAAYILRFDFIVHHPKGEFQMLGGSLNDYYSLPESGESKAFGSGPNDEHTLILENSSTMPEDISFRFVGRVGADDGDVFARVTAEPTDEKDRSIEVISLTPFRVHVSSDHDNYLETPKLFVSGYRALVDGTEAPLVKTPNGLAAVLLTEGKHDVTLRYFGSQTLRWSYRCTAVSWVLFLGVISAYALRGEAVFDPLKGLVRRLRFRSLRRKMGRSRYGLLLLGAAVMTTAIGLGIRPSQVPPVRYGKVQMSLILRPTALGRKEPLVTTGRAGAGDFIYITYVDDKHVTVGHDKWSYGGELSAPIPVDYGKIQNIEIDMNSLYPGVASEGETRLPSQELRRPKPLVVVKWNGVTVLSEKVAAFPSAENEVTIGDNDIGGSSTFRHFSGEIIKVAWPGPEELP